MCNVNSNTLGIIIVSSVIVVWLATICGHLSNKNDDFEDEISVRTRLELEIKNLKEKLIGLESKQLEAIKNVKMLERDQLESDKDLESLKRKLHLMEVDKTGKVDYAYGGRAFASRQTETFVLEGVTLFGVSICGGKSLEKRILEESVLPGQCWPFKGQRGSAVIELIMPIRVTEVTLEHGHEDILADNTLSSAPREFSLQGLQEESNHPHVFGTFEFKLPGRGRSLQTFKVTHESPTRFKTVELIVSSNHGNDAYTCVYRVRVHGVP